MFKSEKELIINIICWPKHSEHSLPLVSSTLTPHHTYIAHVKFPAGTVAGHYKTAVNTNAERDIIRFNNQKFNWTLVEFDVSFHPHP